MNNGKPIIFNSLGELITLLKASENVDDIYAYRGQYREYDLPLVPSLYRPFVRKDSDRYKTESHKTLRSVQNAVLVDHLIPDTDSNKENALNRQKRLAVAHLQNAFGYAMAQILCQQAGLNSEGIDVTSDLNVAAFFATHCFENGRYVPAPKNEDGIIYRWKVNKPFLSLRSLNEWNFYNCPSYLPSLDILRLFIQTEQLDESIESIIEYKNSIGWGPSFDLLKLYGKRPFELIKIPRDILKYSRINKQSAGLLIPDALLNFNVHNSLSIKPPTTQGVWDGPPRIEDFGVSRNVELYKFKHRHDEHKYIKLIPTDILSEVNDFEPKFVCGWINMFSNKNTSTSNFKLNNSHYANLGLNFPSVPEVNMENQLINGKVISTSIGNNISGFSLKELENGLERAEIFAKDRLWDDAITLSSKVCATAYSHHKKQEFANHHSLSGEYFKIFLYSSVSLSGYFRNNNQEENALAILHELILLAGSNKYYGVMIDAILESADIISNNNESINFSIELLDVVINAFKDIGDENIQRKIACSLHNKGILLDRQNKFIEASQIYIEIINDYRQNNSEFIQTIICRSLFNTAADFHSLSDIKQALYWYNRLLSDFRNSTDPYHKMIVNVAIERIDMINIEMKNDL